MGDGNKVSNILDLDAIKFSFMLRSLYLLGRILHHPLHRMLLVQSHSEHIGGCGVV